MFPKKTQTEMLPEVLFANPGFISKFWNQGTLATAMLMHRLLPAFLGTLAALAEVVSAIGSSLQ